MSKSRTKVGAAVVAALLVGIGVYFLIGQAANYSRLIDAVKRASPWWLVVSLAGTAAGYLGYALLYQGIAGFQSGPRPDLPLTLRLTVAIFGVSILATSAGRLGGEYWSLRRMREDPPQAWVRVLALNTAEWAILACLAWSGAALSLLGIGRGAPLGVSLAWLAVLPACVAAALFLTSGRRRALADDCGGRVRRTFAAALRAVLTLRSLRQRPRALSRVLAGGLIHWAGDLLMVWAALHAFGTHIGYPALVVAYATGYASTILPLPLGGAGGVEAASTYALTLVGVPLGPALLASLVQRVFTYWLPLAIAIVSARSVKRLRGDLSRVPRPLVVAGSYDHGD